MSSSVEECPVLNVDVSSQTPVCGSGSHAIKQLPMTFIRRMHFADAIIRLLTLVIRAFLKRY